MSRPRSAPQPSLDGRSFVPVANSAAGEASEKTVFRFRQEGRRVWATYSGGSIVRGHLLGRRQGENGLVMVYHCVTSTGELRSGEARGSLELRPDGRLAFQLEWQWLRGDRAAGRSAYVEVSRPQPPARRRRTPGARRHF